MKKSKWLSLLFIITLLLGCSSQQTQTSQPSAIPPTQTTHFLDFDHPRLHEIAGNKPLVIDEITRAKEQGQEYVAVIVKTNDPIYKQELLVFRLADNISTLVYDLGPYYYISLVVENEPDPIWLYNGWALKSYHGIIYKGNNSFLLPVLISFGGGNCYECASLKLISISDKGIATDITPHTNFNPKGFVDVGGLDFRIVATQYYEWGYGACDHVSSPFAFRLFKWQETSYIDVSENEKDFYDQKIAELTTKLQEFWNEPLHACWIMPILANIFFDYESSGRVEYGWEQIQALGDLSHWDIQNTPSEEIQTYHDVFDQLEQRKNEDLATATP